MKISITLNNTEFDLGKSIQKLEESLPDWERYIFLFLVDWFSESNTIQIQTSGSTGNPKLISKPKTALRNSAKMTGEFFEFSEGKKALLCLPAKFIAGKMMLVRAIEWGLSLDYIEPKTKLTIPKIVYYFSAMTPPQVEANLHSLSSIENLIIGGAAINTSLEKQLTNIGTKCFATYGMTETVSHISLRKIGELSYTVLKGILIDTNERGCLQITAPLLNTHTIVTNDLVDITSENTFIWLGRFDNVINSGGLKLFPENIEQKLTSLIELPFIVGGIPNEKWGEKLILIIEGEEFNTKNLLTKTQNILPKTHVPKSIYFVPKFQYTENGKVIRKETINLIMR